MASAFGRVGSIAAPTIIGFSFHTLGFGGVFGLTSALLAAGVLVVVAFGVATKGRSLESINHENELRNEADRPASPASPA